MAALENEISRLETNSVERQQTIEKLTNDLTEVRYE